VACKWSLALKPERKPACPGGCFSSRILVSLLVWIFEKSFYGFGRRVVLYRYARDGTSSCTPSLRYSFNIPSSPALFPCFSSILSLLTSLCKVEIFVPPGYLTYLKSLRTFSWFPSRCVSIVLCGMLLPFFSFLEVILLLCRIAQHPVSSIHQFFSYCYY